MKDNLNWRTPARRSQQYVSVIASELGERLKVDHAVQSIQRTSDPATGNTTVRIIDSHGREHIFKRVVFACHPDQILKILGKDATAKEVEVLSAFRYADNDTYVHTDESLMPRARSAWTSWNYIGRRFEIFSTFHFYSDILYCCILMYGMYYIHASYQIRDFIKTSISSSNRGGYCY